MFQTLELGQQGQAKELHPWVKMGCGVIIAGCSIALIAVMVAADKAPVVMTELVAKQLSQSGVENPVTAVLLNFRSYDTLLELAVLLIVALAVLPVASGAMDKKPLIETIACKAQDPVLEALLRWLIPMLVVVAGYMLWTGAALPGGAFQAGALLAGAGVLLQLAGHHRFNFSSSKGFLLMSIGLVTFTVVGLGVGAITGHVLQYPIPWAASLILVIESAATLSIAAILLSLYNSLNLIETDNVKRRTS